MTTDSTNRSIRRHEKIHTVRAVVLAVLRLIALALTIIGVVMVANRLLFGQLSNGDISAAWRVFLRAGQTHGIYLGLPLAVAGVALALLSRRLAHWIVQAPAMGCANCGYETLDEDGRCAECGYR